MLCFCLVYNRIMREGKKKGNQHLLLSTYRFFIMFVIRHCHFHRRHRMVKSYSQLATYAFWIPSEVIYIYL